MKRMGCRTAVVMLFDLAGNACAASGRVVGRSKERSPRPYTGCIQSIRCTNHVAKLHQPARTAFYCDQANWFAPPAEEQKE